MKNKFTWLLQSSIFVQYKLLKQLIHCHFQTLSSKFYVNLKSVSRDNCKTIIYHGLGKAEPYYGKSVHLMFIGPCIILIVEKTDQLGVTCFIISLFNAQHVSDVNTSILRSLRLIC